MFKQSLLALFASSLCLTACGGGDGGGSGVDGSKDLLSLTDEEIIDICEYSESLLDGEFDEIGCYAQGIFGASDGGDCESIFDACMASIEPEPSDCPTAADEELPACAAQVTVDEIESCLSAQARGIRNVDISCATTPEELENLEPPTPAECDVVNQKCPELLGEEGE